MGIFLFVKLPFLPKSLHHSFAPSSFSVRAMFWRSRFKERKINPKKLTNWLWRQESISVVGEIWDVLGTSKKIPPTTEAALADIEKTFFDMAMDNGPVSFEIFSR